MDQSPFQNSAGRVFVKGRVMWPLSLFWSRLPISLFSKYFLTSSPLCSMMLVFVTFIFLSHYLWTTSNILFPVRFLFFIVLMRHTPTEYNWGVFPKTGFEREKSIITDTKGIMRIERRMYFIILSRIGFWSSLESIGCIRKHPELEISQFYLVWHFWTSRLVWYEV